MIGSVTVVGPGRVGTAVSQRLAERGLAVSVAGRGEEVARSDVILLCVPDAAIAGVARTLEVGPWVAHVSGATSLTALDPHTRRFGVHPLQTVVRSRGPEQLEGAFGAIGGETADALELAAELARLLGLRPFELADAARPLYHAAAQFGAAFLVALSRVGSSLLEGCAAPADALVPMMRRVIENGFELTGPIGRGDWATVEAHLDAIRAERPELEPLYRALADATSAGVSAQSKTRAQPAAGSERVRDVASEEVPIPEVPTIVDAEIVRDVGRDRECLLATTEAGERLAFAFEVQSVLPGVVLVDPEHLDSVQELQADDWLQALVTHPVSNEWLSRIKSSFPEAYHDWFAQAHYEEGGEQGSG